MPREPFKRDTCVPGKRQEQAEFLVTKNLTLSPDRDYLMTFPASKQKKNLEDYRRDVILLILTEVKLQSLISANSSSLELSMMRFFSRAVTSGLASSGLTNLCPGNVAVEFFMP